MTTTATSLRPGMAHPGAAHPGVALLVPCHNAAAYLPELFAGVAGQTLPFADVLCFDDASTDDTATVARALGAQVISGAVRRGPAAARNRLLEATTAEWVHFHDADDLIAPTFVARMTRELGPHVDAVLCGMAVEDRPTRRRVGGVSYAALPSAADPVAYFVEQTGYAIVGVYRRDALRRIGGFREELRGNEDPDLHVRLSAAGARFAAVDEELVTNLMHDRSLSATHWDWCLEDRLRCLEQYLPGATAARRRAIGRQALSLAWLLFDRGERAGARRAVGVARAAGMRTIDSHRRSVRVASWLLGPEVVFHLRRWLRRGGVGR